MAYFVSQHYFYVKRKLSAVLCYIVLAFIISVSVPFIQLYENIDRHFWQKGLLLVVGLSLPFVVGLIRFSIIKKLAIEPRNWVS